MQKKTVTENTNQPLCSTLGNSNSEWIVCYYMLNICILPTSHFSGITTIGYCGIYSVAIAPLQKSYLWYGSKNPWLWDKILSHGVVLAVGFHEAEMPSGIPAPKLPSEILWFYPMAMSSHRNRTGCFSVLTFMFYVECKMQTSTQGTLLNRLILVHKL